MTLPQELTEHPHAPLGEGRSGTPTGGRALLIGACLLVNLQWLPVDTGFLMPVLQACAAVLAVLACTTAAGRFTALTAPRVTAGLVGALVGFGLLVSGLRVGLSGFEAGVAAAGVAVLIVGYAAVGTAAVLGRRRWPLLVFLVVHVVLLILVIATSDVAIDVRTFLQEGTRSLLAGGDPYAIRIPNPYTAAESHRYYSPGLVVDGRLIYGFPYLPVSLLAAVPGFLLGDVRFSYLAILVVATVLLLRLAPDREGRALAVLGIAGPTSVSLLLNAWVEPTLMLGLVLLSVAALRQRWKLGGAGLVVLLGTKQYVVVVLPLLAGLRRHIGGRGILLGVVSTLAVLTPFVVVNPVEFYRSVVEFHLRQPFRPDSVSLLVSSVQAFGWPPPPWYGPLPLLAGFATSALMAWKMPRTTVCFVVSVGVTMLVTVLLSKQAFSNYYALISFAFLVGAVIWPLPEAQQRR